MRCANGGYARSVTRDGKPVMNGGADLAPLDGRLARPMMTCDEQNEAIARVFRSLESEIDGPPGAVETVAVKIDDAIGLH
jgi:hypothetical protein